MASYLTTMIVAGALGGLAGAHISDIETTAFGQSDRLGLYIELAGAQGDADGGRWICATGQPDAEKAGMASLGNSLKISSAAGKDPAITAADAEIIRQAYGAALTRHAKSDCDPEQVKRDDARAQEIWRSVSGSSAED